MTAPRPLPKATRPRRRRYIVCALASACLAGSLHAGRLSFALAGDRGQANQRWERFRGSAREDELPRPRALEQQYEDSESSTAQDQVPAWITAGFGSVIALGVAGILVALPVGSVATGGTEPAIAAELRSPSIPGVPDIPLPENDIEGPGFEQLNPFAQGPPGRQPIALPGPEARPPADDKAPDIPLEERHRRQTIKSELAFNEIWYERGKRVYVAKCAGCHPGGQNSIKRSKDLTWGDMTRNGYGEKPYGDPVQIANVIRYGKGRMPGFAADCAEKSDIYNCGVIVPLSEETLMDLQDFIVNRANNGWTGRGGM